MVDSPASVHPAAAEMREIYQFTLQAVVDLTDDQLRWQANPRAPSIRFHLFHITRWADHLQRGITGAANGIWDAEDIASQWELDPGTLGYGESGAMIDDDVAMNLPLPAKEILLGYVRRVLGAVDDALGTVDTKQSERPYTLSSGTEITIEELIILQLSHTSRHLGMIECLRGVQGLRGTATV